MNGSNTSQKLGGNESYIIGYKNADNFMIFTKISYIFAKSSWPGGGSGMLFIKKKAFT